MTAIQDLPPDGLFAEQELEVHPEVFELLLLRIFHHRPSLFVERFYSPKRPHSMVGYLGPVEFENAARLA